MSPERKSQILDTYRGKMRGADFISLAFQSPDYRKYANQLIEQGFSIYDESHGHVIEWEGMREDHLRMDQVMALVRTTVGMSDADYAEQILPQVQALLGGRSAPTQSLFYMLDDESKRKLANGFDGSHTPFKHSIVVAQGEQTSDNLSLRYVQRVSSIFHDLGKVGLIPGDRDEETWHAEWSYLFLQDYFFTPSRFDLYSESELGEIDLILRTVRYHHVLEQIEKDVMTPDNPLLMELFQDAQLMESIARLTDADTASVKGYERFRVEAISSILQIFTELQRRGQEFGAEVVAFVQSHIQGLFELIRNLISEINDAITSTLSRYDATLSTAIDSGVNLQVQYALYQPLRTRS